VTLPPNGARVAVTSTGETAEHIADELHAVGAVVVAAPLVVIADPESWTDLDAALKRLAGGDYQWILFTSGNAVTKVMERLAALDLGPASIRCDVAAVGPATARRLERFGVRARAVPDWALGSAAADAMGSGSRRVLLPRVAGGPRDLVESLTALGWQVDEVAAYRNEPARPDSPGIEAILSGEYDVMTLASASAARHLVSLAPPEELRLSPGSDRGKLVACIGPPTEAGARAAGLRVDIVASEHTATGLVKAIVEHVRGMAP
jgi:uroporphyrinogen-III synthase